MACSAAAHEAVEQPWAVYGALPEIRLSTVLAIVPGAIFIAASVITPVFVSRSVLIFTPYLMLLVAAGLVALFTRPRVALPVLLAVLVLHVASLRYYATSHHSDPTDYRGLVALLLPQLEPDDAVFVTRHWVTTPIFYYLDPAQHRVVHENYADAMRDAPARRIWVLDFQPVPVLVGTCSRRLP